jgi:hypothetical protein
MFETFINRVEFICIGCILLCAVYIVVAAAVVADVIEPNRVKKRIDSNTTRNRVGV